MLFIACISFFFIVSLFVIVAMIIGAEQKESKQSYLPKQALPESTIDLLLAEKSIAEELSVSTNKPVG
jgi:hypothetical protein